MHIRLSPTSYRHSQLHPFAAPMTPPIPVVSNNHDTLDDENDCPVCLEPLSFSFRLPGEKPHVVPECGHALHEVSSAILPVIFPTHAPPQACFTAVYGPLPGQNKSRKLNLGVCGVCRRPMKGDVGKSNSVFRSSTSLRTPSPCCRRARRPHRHVREQIYKHALSRPRNTHAYTRRANSTSIRPQ